MDRTTVYRYDEEWGPILDGHFDRDKAEAIDEETRWNGSNNVSVHTRDEFDHQRLYRTAQGRWVLHGWSQRQGRADTFEFISDEYARDWLIVNNDEAVLTRFFPDVPEERGPGRPAIGPAVTIRFPPTVLEAVDAAAAAVGMNRSEYMRHLVELHVLEVVKPA